MPPCAAPHHTELLTPPPSLSRRETAPPLDVLLIKCASLAAPLIFAQAIVRPEHPLISDRFVLRSIIAVVDPGLAPWHLRPDTHAAAQLRAADIVVVNTKPTQPWPTT